MSVLQSWNQLPSASFQMEKKKVIKFPFPSSGLTCTGRPRVNSALLKSCVRNTPAGWRPASPRSESKTNAQGPAASLAAPSETSAQPWPWEQTKAESLAEGQRDFPESSFKLCPHGTGPRWIPEGGSRSPQRSLVRMKGAAPLQTRCCAETRCSLRGQGGGGQHGMGWPLTYLVGLSRIYSISARRPRGATTTSCKRLTSFSAAGKGFDPALR